MITAAAAAADWLNAHPDATTEQREYALEQVPAWQWAIRGGWWKDLARHCTCRVEIQHMEGYPDGIPVEALRHFATDPDWPRCLWRSPDDRGLAWLYSGGGVRAYACCEQSACPRAVPSDEGGQTDA